MIFQDRKNKRNGDNKIRLIFTHNWRNPPLHKWLREAKQTLVKNQKAKELGDTIQIATKQPKNIQKIVRGTNKGGVGQVVPPDAGCNRCRKWHQLLNKLNWVMMWCCQDGSYTGRNNFDVLLKTGVMPTVSERNIENPAFNGKPVTLTTTTASL